MRHSTLQAVTASVSGGITGILVYFAVFGFNERIVSPFMIVGLAAAASVIAVFMSYSSSVILSVFSGGKNYNETAADIAVFCLPVLALLSLPFCAAFYPKLSALSPSVFGSIYVPFSGFKKIDMARFLVLFSSGAAWLAVFFITAARFAVKFCRMASSLPEKAIRKILFWSALIFFILTTSYITFVYPPTGDEPHYLITARSMVSDLDFDLENNYTDPEEYGRYFPAGLDYKSLHTVKGKNNGVYTSHDMGLPFLIAPFVKIGGRFGVQFFMNIMAALLCLAVYMMLSGMGISKGVSAGAALVSSACMPLMAGSSLVLTEIPAALITAFSMYALSAKTSRKETLVFFALISFLPWLHLKLAVLAASFYLYYYIKTLKNGNFSFKTELINNVPVIMSLALYAWFYHSVYGITSPFGVKELHENIYLADPSKQMNMFVLNPVHFIVSAFAVFFDRDFGLLVYCPLYVTFIWGLMAAARKNSLSMFVPLLPALPYIIVFLFWKDWTGSMTPSRQLIPVLPVFIFCSAYFFYSTGFFRTKLFKILAVSSLIISWALAALPPLRYLASREKIYAFISSHAPREALWFLPPFTENAAAGMTISAFYIILIITAYYKINYKT